MKIIISRTDGIGDVILTLPMLGLIKEQIPNVELIFLNRSYTTPILKNCAHVSQIVHWDEIEKLDIQEQTEALRKLNADVIIHVFPRPEIARAAKLAGIKKRIGTTGRLYHITTCNDLVRFSRKRSNLHEAQLNLKLLKPLGIKSFIGLREIWKYYGLSAPVIEPEHEALLHTGKKNMVLHPMSKGSAVEWGADNYSRLIELLPESDYHIFITGTEAEGQLFRTNLPLTKLNVTDISGKMNLTELMAFISQANALVACSTGPLHIAAALNVCAIGLFSDIRPIHPGRWAPLGQKAHFLVYRNKGFGKERLFPKANINRISPYLVKEKLITLCSIDSKH
jgi:ADP-heptose:LPS heptosyltransferase